MPDTQISEPLTQVERLRLAIALTESYDDRVFEIEPECVEALLKEYDELRDKYNKITAALSGHVVGWRTMDSAPKDGTDIMLAAIDQVFRGEPMPDRVTVGHWTTDDECREVIGDCGGECRCPEYKFHEPSWISWDGGFTEENPPTHWQHLPAPPVPEMEG